jgi:hypothetical protein
MASRRLFLALAFSSVSLCSAWAADVSGTWTISGPVEPVCTITQSGSQLSGSCKGPKAEGPLTGTSEGQLVQFIFRRTGLRGGELTPVTFSGTVSGDSMSGTVGIGQNAGSPFTAHRAGGAPAAPVPSLASAQPPQAASPAPALDTAPPRTVWDTDLDGSAIHKLTDMVCPSASGALKRNQLVMYDKVGFDVSCNYRTAGADITIFLTMRDPSLLQRAFDSAKQAVTTHTPGAVPRSGTLAAPAGLAWLQAAYDEQGGAVRTDVLFAQLSGWEYEIRATFRPENEAMVTAAIADLTDAVRRSAGTHLAACAAAGRAVDGTGSRNRNLDTLQTLSMAAAAITKLTVTTPTPGAVWCADTGFGIGPGDYVWWRNITPANDGPVDRITSIKGDVGRTIFVVRVGAAGSVDGNTTYAVVVDDAQSTKIAGIFNGQPSFKDITGLVLQGAFGVYAEIKKPNGSITVYKPF